ncbi:hypothetical protein KIL84_014725, partial [Mauremys mutica]
MPLPTHVDNFKPFQELMKRMADALKIPLEVVQETSINRLILVGQPSTSRSSILEAEKRKRITAEEARKSRTLETYNVCDRHYILIERLVWISTYIFIA